MKRYADDPANVLTVFGQKEKLTKGFVKPNVSCASGDPYGSRTHDSTVKGWRLSRLTNGPQKVAAAGLEPATDRV